MGVLDIVPVRASDLLRTTLIGQTQAGVLTGDNVRKLFDYAKEKHVSRDPRKHHLTHVSDS